LVEGKFSRLLLRDSFILRRGVRRVGIEHFLVNSIPLLNEVFRGGIGEESLIHIYGPYQSGKTLLLFQILYEFVSRGYGNALFIDTEASFRNNFSTEMKKRFENRFSYSVNILDVELVRFSRRKKKELNEVKKIFEAIFGELDFPVDDNDLYMALKIFFKDIRLESSKRKKAIYLLDNIGLKEFLYILNIRADIERVGGKTEVKIKELGDPIASSLSNFINKYGVKFLVIDSLGMLVKGLAVGLSDLPARASVTNLIIGGLIRLASHYKLIVFATNHESRNPVSNLYSFYGGSPIGYGFKYSLYLARKGIGKRMLVVERSPIIAERSLVIPLEIREDGFYQADVDGDNK
jgi:hypothetical protein